MTSPTPQPYAAQPLSPSDEKLWASLAHFGNILGLLPSLLIFLILKDRSVRVRQESKEALNFIITALIGYVVLIIVQVILGGIAGALPSGIALVFIAIGFLVGLVQIALYMAVIVFSILGGIRVNGGGSYRYPVNLRLIK
ncbi:DUF4870 domain-containing protein [uncultured Amnibacterium sp.]|uniref:DUF4870 domain-containing protein n=1 Tax=uncultured Amnibacterium sp. TaxID=1631851 RepID=UPI0035CB75E4